MFGTIDAFIAYNGYVDGSFERAQFLAQQQSAAASRAQAYHKG